MTTFITLLERTNKVIKRTIFLNERICWTIVNKIANENQVKLPNTQ